MCRDCSVGANVTAGVSHGSAALSHQVRDAQQDGGNIRSENQKIGTSEKINKTAISG